MTTITITITINGHAHGPTDVRDDLTMNDYLREYLGMTGTKFGCGAAQCLSCAIIIDEPDGNSYTSPTCIVPAISFNGSGSGVPWFAYPVGGATITGNVFMTHLNQYIRARGIYDTNTFDWKGYFTKNTFPGALTCRS